MNFSIIKLGLNIKMLKCLENLGDIFKNEWFKKNLIIWLKNTAVKIFLEKISEITSEFFFQIKSEMIISQHFKFI